VDSVHAATFYFSRVARELTRRLTEISTMAAHQIAAETEKEK
jgi:hypothetical protein